MNKVLKYLNFGFFENGMTIITQINVLLICNVMQELFFVRENVNSFQMTKLEGNDKNWFLKEVQAAVQCWMGYGVSTLRVAKLVRERKGKIANKMNCFSRFESWIKNVWVQISKVNL